MKNIKTLIIIVLVFVLLIGGAAVLYKQLGNSITPEQLATQETQPLMDHDTDDTQQKIKAPNFIVYDAEGNVVQLTDFVGKPIVLNFWASWCSPCQVEMPGFQEKYLELGEDVNFLMVNMTAGRETMDSASNFIAKKQYTFPVFYDTESNAAMTYGAYSLPTTYFIDAEGYAIAQATGAIDAETLQQGIDLISNS